MSATETWTVGRLLTWTTEFLKKNGSHSPRLDAEVLLAHARDCRRIELYTAFDDEASEQQRVAFREMVRRRAEGTPVAYLVGYKEFYSTSFEVNPDVLIPRPETEHLVVEALDRAKAWQPQPQPLRIVDVGTGSGIIAITLAKQLPAAEVTAIDISPAALAVARRNAERHELPESQLHFIEGDLLAGTAAEPAWEMIVSNPPYVSQAEYAELEASVKDFEPRLALLAGPTGSELIERLIAQSLPRLVPGGLLIFEFSPMLAPQLAQIVGDGWETPQVTKDLAGHARIVTLRKS